MIAIDNKLVSDELIEENFVCNLNKCKGGCCVDGDAGAPLEKAELKIIDETVDTILPYLPAAHRKEIERQGHYVYDKEFGWVTPAINGGICVYAITDKGGVVKCAFEQAYYEGKIAWKKPISCHLFPVRIETSKGSKAEFVNYEPRQVLCAPACQLGDKLKMPVYKFLKEALIRKYGEDFYEALDAVAEDYFQVRKRK